MAVPPLLSILIASPQVQTGLRATTCLREAASAEAGNAAGRLFQRPVWTFGQKRPSHLIIEL